MPRSGVTFLGISSVKPVDTDGWSVAVLSSVSGPFFSQGRMEDDDDLELLTSLRSLSLPFSGGPV